MIAFLLRLYPARWRTRYGDEFAALLAERPLGPFDVADVLLGALDAQLHLRGLGSWSEHRRGFPMSLRLGGVAAFAGGTLMLSGWIWSGVDPADEDPGIWLVLRGDDRDTRGPGWPQRVPGALSPDPRVGRVSPARARRRSHDARSHGDGTSPRPATRSATGRPGASSSSVCWPRLPARSSSRSRPIGLRPCPVRARSPSLPGLVSPSSRSPSRSSEATVLGAAPPALHARVPGLPGRLDRHGPTGDPPGPARHGHRGGSRLSSHPIRADSRP